MFRYKNGKVYFRIRKDMLLALVAAVFLFWRPADISSEDIILTSYYPAPYGGYDRLFTTGNAYLAHQGGMVYWGPGDASYLSRDQGGGIVLGSTGMYGSPGISITTGGGRYSSAIGIGYIGREAVLTIASGREQQNVRNQGGDLYIGGFLRRMCKVQDTRYGSSTYCGGSATASTKYVVLPAVRPFKFSGNTTPPANQNVEDDGRSLIELEIKLAELKKQQSDLQDLKLPVVQCMRDTNKPNIYTDYCIERGLCYMEDSDGRYDNAGNAGNLKECMTFLSEINTNNTELSNAIKEMEEAIAKLKQEAAKTKPKPAQNQDNHGLDRILCCRFELVS